ncbi:hypothetical protein [Phenylobacterium sp.]|uniref:hypothetical protein n=1 Tax=Phenylobacterium sp. TaxID=1871053 RepID=UPI002FCCB66A
MSMDDDWSDFPVILGQGSCHTLTDDSGRVFGDKAARIRVRPKPRPIGFHLPPKTKGSGR